jgi:hypothetical protein
MKLKFKINLKDSKIPDRIMIPRKLKGFMGFNKKSKLYKGKVDNLIEKKYLKKIYSFEYDKKNKILKSTDNLPKHIHGIYPEFNLKRANVTEDGLYVAGWFDGAFGEFKEHIWVIRHIVRFDPLKKHSFLMSVLENQIAYYFKKTSHKKFRFADASTVKLDLIK